MLSDSWIMILLFSDHTFSILDLFDRLSLFLIGEMDSSTVMVFVQKFRTIPCSLRVCTPRIGSNAGLDILFGSYSTTSGLPDIVYY